MRVAFSGFLRDSSGYGEAARRILWALRAVPGIDLQPGMMLNDGLGTAVQDEAVDELWGAPRKNEDVHLVFASATDFAAIRDPSVRTIGLTCWETDRLHPAFLAGIQAVDHLLVPSWHNSRIVRRAGHMAVARVPYPIAEPMVGATLPVELPPHVYVFYSIASWQERKNPLGLLISYLTTFTAEDPVALVLKTSGIHEDVLAAEVGRLMAALNLPNPPRALVSGAQWTPAQVWALHEHGDCYVSLSRGEAYGLPILDAMTVGNHVIATGWGGHLDFMGHPTVGGRVHYTMTPVVQAYHYFSGEQCWADPDLLDAGKLMRMVLRQADDVPLRPSTWSEFTVPEVSKRLQQVLMP